MVSIWYSCTAVSKTGVVLKWYFDRHTCKHTRVPREHTTQRHTAQRHTSQRHTSQRHISQRHTTQKHTTQRYTTQRHTSPLPPPNPLSKCFFAANAANAAVTTITTAPQVINMAGHVEVSSMALKIVDAPAILTDPPDTQVCSLQRHTLGRPASKSKHICW